MRRWGVVFGIILILSLLGYIIWQGYFGYQHYSRAVGAIEAIDNPAERDEAWREFNGYSKQMYGGILIGTLPGHVWVMGQDGLRHYPTDQYTAYSTFDGCSPEILLRLNTGETGAITREVTSEMSEWRARVRVGDYVRAYPTHDGHLADSAGTLGNLREIYAYNFWLFMPWGMEERCQVR